MVEEKIDEVKEVRQRNRMKRELVRLTREISRQMKVRRILEEYGKRIEEVKGEKLMID